MTSHSPKTQRWSLIAPLFVVVTLALLIADSAGMGILPRVGGVAARGAAGEGVAIGAAGTAASSFMGARLMSTVANRTFVASRLQGTSTVAVRYQNRIVYEGTVERSGNIATLRNPQGAIEVQSEIDGLMIRHRSPNGTQLGRSEISQDGSRIRHFENHSGSERAAGYDIRTTNREIAHYDESGRLLGNSTIGFEESQSGAIAAIAIAFAAIQEKRPPEKSRDCCCSCKPGWASTCPAQRDQNPKEEWVQRGLTLLPRSTAYPMVQYCYNENFANDPMRGPGILGTQICHPVLCDP